MNELNALTLRRGIIKGQLTKFANIVQQFSEAEDIIQLKTRKEKIDECWTAFQKIQSTIEERSSTPQIEESYRDDFENLYYAAVATYTRIIEKQKLDESQSNQISNNEIENNALQSISSARSSGSNLASIVKLAALSVPNFSGDYKQWSTFNDMFIALIHSNDALTDIQKFFYLKSALSGDAEKVVCNRMKPQQKII